MHIDWAIPCRYVEVYDSSATIVGAGTDDYAATELPSAIEVTLVLRLLATPDELRDDVLHHARSRVRDPRGALIGELGREFRAGGGVVREGWLTGIMVGTTISFEAAGEGTYTIEQEVDGDTKALPIHVVHEPLPA